MKHIQKQAMTLALLLGAATGAWAQDDIQVTQVQGQVNQWQYTMPDDNVELTVKYFPTAAFSEGGQPTAIQGIIAGTDAALVSTGQSQQGTVMYYATTDATAPDYDAAGWTSTVPTAAIVEGDKTESTRVYVFYYIKGNDAPEGQAATAENTFSDTDILGPLTVTLKKNVFTVALRPLTQFTTDGGQATVTVDEQSAGNYSLKQGQTITVTAAEGYKIRSAKMGGAAIPAGEVISSDLGMLLGKDGNLYANIAAAEAAGTYAVAKIVYVGSNTGVEGYDRGLALHLMDMYRTEIPGAYWCQPSKAQWETMFKAAGGYQALSDGLRESGGNDLYSGLFGDGCYYSTDELCFDFKTGKWVEAFMYDERNIHAIASAALSGDDATLNDAKTVATYTVPDHDASVKYLLARDLTQQVAFDGIPAESVGVTMGPDGNYQPATPLDIQLNDAIADADIIGADGLTVSYEKQDGDNWTAADDFLADMQPGTYRIVAAATDEMSPYDGTLTSATFTLTDNGIWLDETADNSPVLAKKDGQQANVSLTRTLQAGGYNTFAAPFAIGSDVLTAKGITAKQLTASAFDSKTDVLSLTFATVTSLEAGKPYLVKVGTNVENPTFEGVTISSTATTTETEAVDFIPTLGVTAITADAQSILFLSAGNRLYNPAAANSQQIKGFRAYFLLKGDAASARSFSLDFGDGEVLGIREIENGRLKMENGGYDLQGRRMEPSIFNSQSSIRKKGVYIVNGKKIVIK
jgi:hypothetical protein